MISPAAVVIAIYVLVRLVQRKPLHAPVRSAGDVAVTVLVFTFLLVTGPLLLAGEAASVLPTPVVALLAAACLVVAFPWLLARSVAIPLGLPRLAYGLALLARLTGRRDRRGTCLLAGAWALLRSGRRDERAAAFLEARLARCAPLGGAGLAGRALLLLAQGSAPDEVRPLLAEVPRLHRDARPGVARRLAAGWLAADAAERGDWERVAALHRERAYRTRTTRLLAAAARRLLGEGGRRSTARLLLAWLLAPRRRATLGLVRTVLADGAGTPCRPNDLPLRPAPAPGGPLAATLAAHVRLVRGGPGPLDAGPLLAAWDAALEGPAVEERLARRGAALGVATPAGALERLRREAAEEVARAALERGLPPGEGGGPVGSLARRLVEDELMRQVEEAAEGLSSRVERKGALPPADELREALSLRERYEKAGRLLSQQARRSLYPAFRRAVSGQAVWLFNDRAEKPVGNLLLSWLLAEAEALGDQESVAMQRKNLALGV